jgi:hypothetical protein
MKTVAYITLTATTGFNEERKVIMMICQTCLKPLTTGHMTAIILGERFRCHAGCEPIFSYEDCSDRRKNDQRALPFEKEEKVWNIDPD